MFVSYALGRKAFYFTYVMIFIVTVNSNNAPKYGEFVLHVQKFDPCKGPKRIDCAVATAKILDDGKIFYDMVVYQNMKPTKSKITASSNGKQLARLQTKNPCDHLFLRPLIQSMLNVTDNCVIVKGHYSFQIDVEQIAKTYYQGAFIYGNLTFKAVFFNEHCNLSCTVVEVTTSPKESVQ